MNFSERSIASLDPQDTASLRRVLVDAGRDGQLENALTQYSGRISTLLQNDTTLIHHSELDTYIRVLCPNVEALTNLNEAWYNGQLETLRYCGLMPSIENPVITAVDGEEYRAPGLDQLRSRFTIKHLLRIKRLHEGDGTPQYPPRTPVARLVALGSPLEKVFKDVTGARSRNFNQNPGECFLQLESDQPGRKKNQQELLYNGKTKLELIQQGRAWELVFIDGRTEMTRAEIQEGNSHLNADQLAARFKAQGLDLTYVDDLMALHAGNVAREGGQPFDTRIWSMALGNTLMGLKDFPAGGVPHADWSEYDQRLRLGWNNPQYEWGSGCARAAVRVRKS